MRNYELLEAIYKRCPKTENFANGGREQLTTDQLFDRCLDVIDLIKSERPAIVEGKREFTAGGKQRYQ
jgi:hypothetical protein